MNRISTLFAALALGLAGAGESRAALNMPTEASGVVGFSYWSPGIWSSFTNTGNVLLNAVPSASTGDFAREQTTGIPAITDGIAAPLYQINDQPNWATNHAGLATTDASNSLTYTFGTPVVLTSIELLGGWPDAGRSDALFSVAYSTDGLNYTTLESTVQNIGGTGAVAWRATLTDATPTVGNNALITNLRILFAPGDNGYQGLTEIAAYGTAVPEPGVCGFLGLALPVLLGSRRRARRNA